MSVTSLPVAQINDAHHALAAVRALSDMLCELPSMAAVNPDSLNALITIVADKLEAALDS